MKRLFIALKLPAEDRSAVENFLQPYKSHHILRSAKWVPSENYHVTALFLGEVPDHLLSEIRELTRGVCGRMGSFELRPDHIGLYPPKNHAKMLWLRYQKSLAFDEFVGELKRFLLPVLPDLEDEEKGPLPHVTLARLKEHVDPKTLSFQPISLPNLKVTEATLFESDLRPEGSLYTAIETFPYAL